MTAATKQLTFSTTSVLLLLNMPFILCSVSGSHTTALNGFKRVIILYWTSQSMAWLVPAMSSQKRLTCG